MKNCGLVHMKTCGFDWNGTLIPASEIIVPSHLQTVAYEELWTCANNELLPANENKSVFTSTDCCIWRTVALCLLRTVALFEVGLCSWQVKLMSLHIYGLLQIVIKNCSLGHATNCGLNRLNCGVATYKRNKRSVLANCKQLHNYKYKEPCLMFMNECFVVDCKFYHYFLVLTM